MGFFAGRGTIKTPPEPTLAERLVQAEQAVDAARAEIETILEDKRAFERQYNIVLNPWGQIRHCELQDASGIATLQAELHQRDADYVRAKRNLDLRLGQWAGLKEASNATGK
jgi:hypothetical protein